MAKYSTADENGGASPSDSAAAADLIERALEDVRTGDHGRAKRGLLGAIERLNGDEASEVEEP